MKAGSWRASRQTAKEQGGIVHQIDPQSNTARLDWIAFAGSDDTLHRKATAVDQRINIFNMKTAAGRGALDSLSCFVHGDAIDMEMTSHFVCAKGDAPDLYTKPFTGHWFPGNAGDARELNTAILFLHLENFATPLTVACKPRAEWTFSPKPKSWESRPNLSTVRVTGM